MKRTIMLSCLLWLLLITASHLHFNVGWADVQESVSQSFGKKRDNMIVGFLPVT
jgi:hypothetical protein